MVEHFAAQVQGRIGGRAKAMIVTRSRLHAVRYKRAVDAYLAGEGYQRSPEPVFLAWKSVETAKEGDFFVRSGPGTVKLTPNDAQEYVRTQFADVGTQ